MKMKKLSAWPNLPDYAFLGLALLALVSFKIPHLSLPGFWDEAWSYMPAILKMSETGPALLPESASAGLFRGHPLLFYAIAALWINIFGQSFFAMRILPLLISAGLVIALYLFSKKHFGRTVAMITTLFLLIQALFLAQSSMLLPEMLLALLTLLALGAFLDRRKGWYILFATLLALTKETGLVLIGTAILLHFFLPSEGGEKISIRKRFNTSFYVWAPLLIDLMFLLAQRFITGWFFFPEHIGLLSFAFTDIWSRFTGYTSFLFIGFGRNLLTFTALAALLYAVIRRIRVTAGEWRVLIPLMAFSVFYLVFLSLNFYSPRYLLSVLPVVLLLGIFIILRATSKWPWAGYLVLLIALANNLWFTWDFRRDADHNLGFADAVQVQQQAVNYCLQLHLQDSTLATHFLMRYDLEHPEAGYVPRNKAFKKVTFDITPSVRWAVISSTEFSKDFKTAIEQNNMLLVKRFEKRRSWTEIYRARY